MIQYSDNSHMRSACRDIKKFEIVNHNRPFPTLRISRFLSFSLSKIALCLPRYQKKIDKRFTDSPAATYFSASESSSVFAGERSISHKIPSFHRSIGPYRLRLTCRFKGPCIFFYVSYTNDCQQFCYLEGNYFPMKESNK